MNLTSPPGVFDIIPYSPKEEWRSTHLWIYVEGMIRQITAEYGFQEIRTPIFERTELFHRTVGETSDIVSKEMYTFIDRGERSMSLRPEGTAAAMRAFGEHRMDQIAPINKLFYIAPMFRYERAQAGRYRQHHQFGAEVIGNAAAEQDAEVIDLLYTLYKRLGLKNLQVNINSIGDPSSRALFKEALMAYLHQHHDRLSEDSQRRLKTNPLRILDSKDPQDKEINKEAPSILEFLNEECRAHFSKVQSLLKLLGIPFEVNHLLVRGLDYYNKTVFEITSGELGAQNSIAGGGRYDGLLKTLGGPDLPAIGFGMGMERVIQTMINQKVSLPKSYFPELFIIAIGERAKNACFLLLHELRQAGVHVQMDFSDRKLNKVMQYANQIGAAHVAVIGEDELDVGKVELKTMSDGSKKEVLLVDLPKKFKK